MRKAEGLLLLFGLLGSVAAGGCNAGGGSSGAPPPPPAKVTLTNAGAYYGAGSPLNLSYAIAGQGAFTLLATGTGFTATSVVEWNGSALPTTYGDSTDLAAGVSSALIAGPGTASIMVKDSATGAASNAVSLGIASPGALTAGAVQLITAAADGTPGDADSLVGPSISADGRYVAFQSAATNLVPGPASGFQDIYIRDTCVGSAPQGCAPSTARVSVSDDGSPTNGHSYDSSISGDGRFVAFDSSATNILPGTTLCGGTACLFLRDTCNGAPAGCTTSTTLVSVAMDGATANGGSPWLSLGGRFVAFDSSSTDVASGDTNNAEDVFVRDTCFGVSSGCVPITARVSVSSTDSQGNSDSHGQVLNNTGRFVAFESYATNLTANDTVAPGMFVRDTCGGASGCTPSTSRLDVTRDGSPPNNYVFRATPAISGDGRLVAFGSGATNLTSANVQIQGNVYVRDTCTGAAAGCTPSTSLASVGNDGSLGNCGSPSDGLSMSADGRFVAFDSIATNLVPGDTYPACGWEDVFVRDTCVGAASGCVPSTVRVSVASTPVLGTQANANSRYPAMSADGHYVVFLSSATNLISGITGNGHQMVYLAKTGF